MERWEKSLSKSLHSLEELAQRFGIDPEPLRPVVSRYPMRISPSYLRLIEAVGDPIWRQCVPDIRELDNGPPHSERDEALSSPIPGMIHRYPDRVVLLVSVSCATWCRFCMRKKWMASAKASDLHQWIGDAIGYIHQRPLIRDVILSGGDPLVLPNEVLEDILIRLRRIPHVEILRIGSRAPVTMPERITFKLCRMLKKYHPLYVITHFNHPKEITEESSGACARLVDSGIPVENQTVLLRGINDEPSVMKALMQRLLRIRVRPYYLHHPDRVQGTSHFWVSVEVGKRLISSLRGYTSGLAVPHYVIDLPGGKGKVPILPDDVRRDGETLYIRNYLGEIVKYPDVE